MQRYTSRHVESSKNRLSTRAKWGIALLSCSVFLLFCIIVNFLPFIRSFILGTFGLATYPVLIVTGIVGGLMLTKKRYTIAKNYVFSLIGLYFILICVLQTALTNIAISNMGEYLSVTYADKLTPGGVLAGIFSYGLGALVNYVGAYIVFGILALICIAFMIDYYLKLKDYKKLNSRAVSYPVQNDAKVESTYIAKQKEKKTLFEKLKEREPKKKEEDVNITLQTNKSEELITHNGQVENANDKYAEKIFGSDYATLSNKAEPKQQNEEPFTIHQFINQAKENSFENFNKKYEQQEFPISQKFQPAQNFNPNQNYNFSNNQQSFVQPQPQSQFQQQKPMPEHFAADLKLEPLQPFQPQNTNFQNNTNSFEDISKIIDEVKPINNTFKSDFGQEIKPKQKEVKHEQLEMSQTKPTTSPTTVYRKPSPYVRPPLNLLTTISSKLEENEADFKENAQILEETLDSFKISAVVESVVQGPAVTRYEIKMPAGISVNKIKQHSDDIAMMMRSVGGVRIEAPIPGKNLVGIELPNKKIATTGLRDVIDAPEFHNSKSAMPFALGKNISGSIKICDLASMPHLLIAGSTGSGKSVCLNIIIVSLLYKMGPDDLKLILIDPKRVEFSSYNGLPHLLTPEAICNPKQALNAFDWAIGEMDKRFSTFQQLKVRNFEEYNSLEAVYKGKEPKLPRIVIIVDELADLMSFAKKDIEDKIMRIAQLARAAGIHLVLATQRPSVDVITGTIKTNLPSRIAFSLNSYQDSMTIINQGGAEKLLGKGDMLYFPQNLPEPVRIQCPFLNNNEVQNIVDFIINNNDNIVDEALVRQILDGKGSNNSNNSDDSSDGIEYDPILPKALFDFIKSGNASISAIQRRYAVGYARAARIVDQMEMNGFISPADGTNKRKVLIDEMRYNELFSDGMMD
ncbi:MAG: DUF87 domain-containing protein [Clostridia bacterium]|nr:DUF87 domain-containing protein [Clostridia bacterium]